ncbi:MAG: alpha/beta fold hydrolase [Lautropia sp.]|nr:alpha/beta fold hydrolase [Lautropia sp.]
MNTKALISGLSLSLALMGAVQAETSSLPARVDKERAAASSSVGRIAPEPVSRLVEAEGPAGNLTGTLLQPADKADAPVVLILPGSGPVDRDGNSPVGIKAGTYRLLAEGLADKGIASVRIDKRGMFGSRKAFSKPDDVTVQDYVTDTHNWIDSIRTETGANCVWVMGHSEGGLIGIVAGQKRPHICGLILVSTMGRPAGDVLREQLKENPANQPILASADQVIGELEAGRRVEPEAMGEVLRPVFRPSVQGFLISVFKIDPARELSAFDKPVLIVQGERDLQIKTTDAKRLHEAARGSKLLLLPKANHVLKDVESDNRIDNMKAYQDRSLPLSPGLIDGIAGFIEAAPQKR